MRTPLVYIIRKTLIVPIYGDYLKYATPDDEMIARMLHLPTDKSKLHNEQSAKLVMEHTAEYQIGNRSIYDFLDQFCKDTDLYPCVKQQRENRGAFYAIYSRWLGPNHVNVTASEAKMALQRCMYDGEKKAWNWEKYVA